MKSAKNTIIIYVLILISMLLTIFVIPNYFQDYAKILNLCIWIIIVIASISMQNEHSRFKGNKDKIQTIIIILIIYYIIYLLAGLIYGFNNNPLANSLTNIIKNIGFIFLVIILQEYVRAKLINSTQSITVYAIVTILFAILRINYTNFFNNFTSGELIFKYLSSVVFVEIIISCLSTYLCSIGGSKVNYAFVIPTNLITLFLPIFPDLDWFLSTLAESVLILTIFLITNYEHTIKISRFSRRDIKSMSPFRLIPTLVLALFLITFIAGLLPYKPVAVMSNSMASAFRRGDIVIAKKISKNKIDTLQVGDVLEYKLDKSTIIHRIIEIKDGDEGKKIFITKGDNNNMADAEPVAEEQVVGIVKFSVPYLGYPSVLLSEIVFSKKSIIET